MSVHDFRSSPAEVTTVAGVPLHRQLFLVLHDEIARGALAPGDVLPTEQTLCEQFGVSRITVRRALADLAARWSSGAAKLTTSPIIRTRKPYAMPKVPSFR